MRKTAIALFAGLAILAASCKKDQNGPQVTQTHTAYLTTTANPMSGQYTGFSFANGAEVTTVDSAATNWDFAMLFVAMKVNSHASGAGHAGVQLVDMPFDSLTVAPEGGYAYDTTLGQPAISGGWYNYNPTTHSFAPIAGKTFVFVTADGKYAKMEMLEALPINDAGEVVTPPTMPTKIKYKFNYNYQPDGGRHF